MTFQPLQNVTAQRLDLDSETVTDYAFGSFDILFQHKNYSGIKIDISANIGNLDYYGLQLDKFRKLVSDFTKTVNDTIETDYIEQSANDAYIHAEKHSDALIAAGNELTKFLNQLKTYRDRNYSRTPNHIEYRSYTAQFERVKSSALSALDIIRERIESV